MASTNKNMEQIKVFLPIKKTLIEKEGLKTLLFNGLSVKDRKTSISCVAWNDNATIIKEEIEKKEFHKSKEAELGKNLSKNYSQILTLKGERSTYNDKDQFKIKQVILHRLIESEMDVIKIEKKSGSTGKDFTHVYGKDKTSNEEINLYFFKNEEINPDLKTIAFQGDRGAMTWLDSDTKKRVEAVNVTVMDFAEDMESLKNKLKAKSTENKVNANKPRDTNSKKTKNISV